MKLKLARLSRYVPPIIAAGVIIAVCLLRLTDVEIFDRMERLTYDMRVRASQKFPLPVATNLGMVAITDDSIRTLNNGSLGFPSYGVSWPRHIYGRALNELASEGARAVAFDVLFAEQHPGDSPTTIVGARRWQDATNFLGMAHPGETPLLLNQQGEEMLSMESDDYFAWQIRRSHVAILAAMDKVYPDPLFATNAAAVGDISAEKDPDGVLRRVCAFQIYRDWHPVFKQLAADTEYGVDLDKAEFEPGKIILPRQGAKAIVVSVDADNNFELADFVGNKLPPGMAPRARAFTEKRVWHMGIQMAAQSLGLDLDHADIDLPHGKITFQGAGGMTRVIPVDEKGYFLIDWELKVTDPRLTKLPFEELLKRNSARDSGVTLDANNIWQGKLMVIGSTATGNNITDRGTTPLEKDTFLVSKHWNVANSILMNRFVRRAPLWADLALIVLLGSITALMTWRLGALTASVGVASLAVAYYFAGMTAYIENRYWLPMVLPIVGAMLMQYLLLVTYQYFFEEREKRRVQSVFSKVVSPNVARELTGMEELKLGGKRREVTVLFADIRGFTEFTDLSFERAEAYVQEHKLTGAAAEACYDESAGETLKTVNLYMTQVADVVKRYDGTLDKYIGDCVMAYWGEPTPNPRHAVFCVRAAIEAQRAIHAMNQQRTEENRRTEVENTARISAGMPPKPMLATLTLGTGINTGSVTVGMMGSETHTMNYTVFGREVNLASRLEHESGRGRIVIGDATYQRLQRDDPALAAACIPLEPVMVKGIRSAVKIYEVPWRETGETKLLKR